MWPLRSVSAKRSFSVVRKGKLSSSAPGRNCGLIDVSLFKLVLITVGEFTCILPGQALVRRIAMTIATSGALRFVAAPDQPHDAVLRGLEQDGPDRLRPGRIVEPHAEISLVGALLRPAPRRADLGCSERHPEIRRAVALLAVVGEDLDASVHAERADVAGIAVLDGRERSDDRHGQYLPGSRGRLLGVPR